MTKIARKLIFASFIGITSTANAEICLESLSTDPSQGYINVDNIYYDAVGSADATWKQNFARDSVELLELQFRRNKKNCTPLNVEARDFVCRETGQEICVAHKPDLGVSVAVVKDFVDEANVLLFKANPNSAAFPAFDPGNDDEVLRVADPSYCYGPLIDNYNRNSSAFSYNVRYAKDWREGRFTLVEATRRMIRDLVEASAEYNETIGRDVRQCEYNEIALRTSDLSCFDFGRGLEVCTLSKTRTGYFDIFRFDGSDKFLLFSTDSTRLFGYSGSSGSPSSQ